MEIVIWHLHHKNTVENVIEVLKAIVVHNLEYWPLENSLSVCNPCQCIDCVGEIRELPF